MLLARALYADSPPPLRTPIQDRPTLLVCWWTTGFAIFLIVLRVLGRYSRTGRLFVEDKIMAWSVVPLLARMAFAHVVLLFGTNNTIADGLTAEEIRRREIGSKCVLAARIFYAAFLWMEKFTISEFLKRLTSTYWKRSYELWLQGIRYFLCISFVGIVISVLAECQPFNDYFQVVPDPGPKCREGVAPLITMASLDVITDILLIIFPISIVLRSSMSVKRKIELTFLFGLSMAMIIITLFRVPKILSRKGIQPYRSLWASFEILAACFVANALVIGSFLRGRGPKRNKFRRYASGTDSMDRNSRRPTTAMYGSDEDLFRDVAFVGANGFTASDDHHSSDPLSADPLDTEANWSFAERQRKESTGNISNADSEMTNLSPTQTHVATFTPRKVSFFDIGGLLEPVPESSANPSSPTMAEKDGPSLSPQSSQDNMSSGGGARRGSLQFLSDLGTLITPAASRKGSASMSGALRSPRRPSLPVLSSESSSDTRRPSAPPPVALAPEKLRLNDVGGLLS